MNQTWDHPLLFTAWFVMIKNMKYQAIIIITAIRIQTWNMSIDFSLNSEKWQTSPIKMILYVILTEILSTIITYVISFNIITDFIRNATIFVTHIWTRSVLSKTSAILSLLPFSWQAIKVNKFIHKNKYCSQNRNVKNLTKFFKFFF